MENSTDPGLNSSAESIQEGTSSNRCSSVVFNALLYVSYVNILVPTYTGHIFSTDIYVNNLKRGLMYLLG